MARSRASHLGVLVLGLTAALAACGGGAGVPGSGGGSSGGSSGGSGGASSGGGSSGASSSGGASSGGGSSGAPTCQSPWSGSSTPAPAVPFIASFVASPAAIAPGQSATLRWTTAAASAIALDGAGVTGTSRSVSPSATTTYTLTATAAGSPAAEATVTVTVAELAGADAVVAVDTGRGRRPISALVYGYNAASAAGAPPGATWLRLGGNRWTAYDWETNYSNAGSDWGPYSNDTYMGSPSDGPGHAALPALADAKAHGLGVCVTVPIQGWVAKDDGGNVPLGGALADRFVPSAARKCAAFTDGPSTTDGVVYQDEFAALLAARFAGASHPLHLLLDNEPDLWASTHAEIQRAPLTYAALLGRSVEYAEALKDAAPGALVFGPASYGWNGFVNLQDAPDAAAHGDFLEYYLATMRQAEGDRGRRLLDVLDLHFYSEARGCGVRVTDEGGGVVSDCTVAARVQAPRSLWDPSFVETSWITQWSTGGAAIQLVPRMRAKIAAAYPGTLLSLSEYNHGAGHHVSGAVAQADALGILGREGVFAASLWPGYIGESFSSGAWLAYRDYDGAGSSFGDISVDAGSSDVDHISAHASVDAARPDRVVVVLVHRPTLSGSALDLRARTVSLRVAHPRALSKARAWQLTSGSPVQGGAARPQRLADPAVSGNAVTLTLPALSVTTVELTP